MQKLLFSLLFLLVSCSSSESERERIQKLPIEKQIQVEAIDAKIRDLTDQLARIDALEKMEDGDAKRALLKNWDEYAKSIDLAGSDREKVDALEARIAELKEERRKIVSP